VLSSLRNIRQGIEREPKFDCSWPSYDRLTAVSILSGKFWMKMLVCSKLIERVDDQSVLPFYIAKF
jgi:hypothetical protein